MASDVVALYLHRGADLPVLADEDQELDPDRWCSHPPAGQQAGQIVSQWIWNVRLELGHQLEPAELCTTEFAPVVPEAKEQQPASRDYGKPSVAASWKAGRFSGQDFVLQSDGAVRCLANQSLVAHERRREADGSLRVVYAASIRSCRPCPRPRAVSMAGQRCREAASGQRAPASPRRWSGPCASFEIGAGGFIGGSASNCCVTNGWRYRWGPTVRLAQLSRLRLCPVHSAHIIVSTFKSGSLATRESQQ